MANTQPFSPSANATLAVTATTGNVAVGSANQGSTFQFCNAGTNICFIKNGTSNAITAATTDIPVLAGAILTYSFPPETTHIAAICLAASTTTLYISRGEGV